MIHNRKDLLSVNEFAQYQNISIEAVKSQIRRGNIHAVKIKAGKGYRKNHPDLRIHYTQLSKEEQQQFLKDRGLLPNEDKKVEESPEKRIFTDLTEKQREVFQKKEAAHKEVIAALEGVPWGKKSLVIERIADSFKMGSRTLERDIKNVAEHGIEALIPGWHSGQHPKVINNEIAGIIENLYLKESGPSKLEVQEILRKEHAVEIPYTTLVRYINTKWTAGQQLLFRNKDEWNRKYSPYIRRDWSKVGLNEVWIGDQKQLDVPCLFRGRAIFPWVTVFMEMKSRVYVGWIVTAIPDAWAVSQAFVYGVRKFGAPGTVYLDRGKQYKAKAIAGGKVRAGKVIRLFEDIAETIIPGIFGELGVEIFWAAPYNAREKPIEPSFRVFNKLRHLFSGYRGPYTSKRPKDLDKILKSKDLPSMEEMSEGIDKIIFEHNERVHSETGKSPNSFFTNFQPVIPSEKLLAFLLMAENHVMVRDSTVNVEGLVYRNDELWKLAGEPVEVRRDPKNIQRAAIIYKNQVFCFAALETPDHYRGPKTMESIKTTRRIRRKVNKWRKSVQEHEGAIEDPLKYAADLEEKEIVRSRDIRPVETKITSLHHREKLARETIEGIEKEDEIDFGEEAAIANKQSIRERYAAVLAKKRAQEEAPKPRRRLIPKERLTMYREDD